MLCNERRDLIDGSDQLRLTLRRLPRSILILLVSGHLGWHKQRTGSYFHLFIDGKSARCWIAKGNLF